MTSVCSFPAAPASNRHYGYMDYSRHTNNAGMALPSIPRRSVSASSTSRSPARSPPLVQTILSRSPPVQALAKVVIQPPTPPDASRRASPSVASTSLSTQLQVQSREDASSGSGSETFVEMLAPKARRARGVRPRGALPSVMRLPEHSTPTPATFEAKAEREREREVRVPFPSFNNNETPRASTSAIFAPKPRPGISPLSKTYNNELTVNGDTPLPPRSASATVGPMMRKKSGEPLKSSLKSRRPVVRGDLSVVTGPMGTKSEPSTPTCIKSVHFDSKLEHVKLFLAEQKPLAVSRDGSPTDDTSGTESDFPAFIYGNDGEAKGKLEVVVSGLKGEEGVGEKELADVKLVSLQLGEDGTSMVGRVRVRNLAFEKWVAVRFTCDNWQTTSEVAARYAEPMLAAGIEAGTHDVFQFTVRLNDMLSRIEEKTMFLAVRYSTAGREMWDNNAGENYQITFKREKVAAEKRRKAAEGRAPGFADLKSKLEKVAQAGAAESRSATVGGFLSLRATRSSGSSPNQTPEEPDDDEHADQLGFTLKSGTPLSSRYDFGASLKSPWRRPLDLNSPPSSAERARTRTHPTTVPHFPRRTGSSATDKRTLIELTRGSPRIFDGDESPIAPNKPFFASSELEDTPVLPAVAMARRARNHQRGYFDLGVAPSASGVRRTPPGSPFGAPGATLFAEEAASPTKGSSGPAAPLTENIIAGTGRIWRVPSGGSEESTPSSASNDESSAGSSPNSSPYEGPVSLAPEDSFPRSPSPGDECSYSAFLNK